MKTYRIKIEKTTRFIFEHLIHAWQIHSRGFYSNSRWNASVPGFKWMNPIKLFWYLIHVKWTVRNGNSISVNITDEHNWKQLEQCLLLLLLVKFGICLYDIGWWKQYNKIFLRFHTGFTLSLILSDTHFSWKEGYLRKSTYI
jgi:hypothetical protein